MTTPRLSPDREDAEWWIEHSLKQIAKEQKNIDAGERDQAIYTSMHLDYMSLGRARYLHGIWFQSLSTRAVVKEARAAFQKAAECIEMSFRMAYDPTLPEYVGDQADWGRVTETRAISGFNAAFMASDFALARRFAPWPRPPPDGVRMDADVCNFVDALQAYLLNDAATATRLLRENFKRFEQHKARLQDGDEDAQEDEEEGGVTNYHTMSTALLGIVEKNERRFNGGLAAHLELYERDDIGPHSENYGTDEEFICDHAIALANLGLWAGLKLYTKHRLLPTDLLISTHAPLSR